MTALLAALALALVATAVAIVRPVWFAAGGFLILVMAKSIDLWTSGVFSYADEVICVVALAVLIPRRLLGGQRLRWLPGLGWFAAFAALGVFSGILVGESLASLALGGFLAIKGVLFGLAIAQIDWKDVSVAKVAAAGGHVLAVLLVAVAVNAAAPQWWASVFTESGAIYYFLGIPSMTGLFVHPGDLGLGLAVAAVAVLAYRHTVGGGWRSLVLLVGSTLGALSSLRRKTIAGLVAALAWVQLRGRRFTRAFVVVLAATVLVLAVAGFVTGVIQDTITPYVLNWQSSPRSLMVVGTFDVAGRYFPLGAGFGRFGSYLADVNYSPEYVRLGFPLIEVVAPGSPYLTDTQWPAIFGEAGWIGGSAYAIGIVRIWVALSRASRSGEQRPWLRFVGLAGMGWMLQVLLESLAAPTLVSSPGFPLIFFVVGIAASMTGSASGGPQPSAVERIVIYQFDPQRPSLGGVDTCIRGLARYHPLDRPLAFVGVDATGTRELGVWSRVTVSLTDREVWFLPVARLDPDNRRRAIPHGLSLVLGVWRYRRQLPQARVVQAHKLETAAFLSWLLPHTPLVYFIHSQSGALAARGSDSRWRWTGRLQSRLEARLVARAASIVVFNREYATELGALNSHVHFSPTWFDPQLVVKDARRETHEVLWVGRIEPPKDAPLAVDVFEALHELHPTAPWSITIVGAGSQAAALAARVEALPAGVRRRVLVPGALPPKEIATLMSRARVLLMTSVPGYEGFPRVLVEGLAAGLPAVVTTGTDTGSLIVDGKNGFVRGRDPIDLARAIVVAVDLDRELARASVAALNGALIIPELLELTATDADAAVRA